MKVSYSDNVFKPDMIRRINRNCKRYELVGKVLELSTVTWRAGGFAVTY